MSGYVVKFASDFNLNLPNNKYLPSVKSNMSESQVRVLIAKKKVKEAENPLLGTMLYLVYTLLKSLSYVLV